MTKLYLLGAGGMARECLDILTVTGREGEVAGLVEENSKRRGSTCQGHPILDLRDLPERLNGLRFVCAIGSVARKQLVERILAAGGELERLIDPRATVSPKATIGPGAIILSGAVVSNSVTLGKNVILNYHASVSHDSTIGDFSTVCPGARIGGYSKLGSQCWIGIGATIKDRTEVGSRAFIGAGACVVEAVPGETLAYGVPAKPIRRLDIETHPL